MPPPAPVTKASTVSVSVTPRWRQMSVPENSFATLAITSSGVEKKNWICFGAPTIG
jgi:hypothetical protein